MLSRFPWFQMPYDITEEVLSHFDAADVLSLLRAGDLEGVRFMKGRLDRLLDYFGLPPKLFFPAMELYNIMLAGSTPVHLLLPLREAFVVRTIDVFVTRANEQALVRWLLSNTEYVLDVSTSRQTRDEERRMRHGYSDLWDFAVKGNGLKSMRSFLHKHNGRTLQLISTHTLNPFAVMGAFHSTCLMNAISHRGLLCAYPELTLCRRSILNTSGSSWPAPLTKCGVKAEHVETYRGRGFEFGSDYFDFWDFNGGMEDIVGFSSHECGQWAYCPRTRRSLLDEGMLLLPFEGCTELQFRQDLPVFFWSMANNGHCNAGDDESDDGFIQEDGLGQKQVFFSARW
ncbi:hypothetical protein BKA70DRAFT_1223545 [Coprinopsis sp. MPI-PUGE-AT-0042]|nr:hypothetical protein BKA70DRAFT_1223545 [Coprinopsis sp. MPI-PUGE-AT-0042]